MSQQVEGSCNFENEISETKTSASISLKQKEGDKQSRKKMKKFTCEKCGAKLVSVYNLRRHQVEVHGDALYTARNTARNKDKIEFVSTIETLNIYSNETICNKCGATFRDSRDLKRHVLEVHEGIKVISRKRFKRLKEQIGNVGKANTLIIQYGKVVGCVQSELETKYPCSEKLDTSDKLTFMCDLCNTGCETFKKLTSHIQHHILMSKDRNENDDKPNEKKRLNNKKKMGCTKKKFFCRQCSSVFKDSYNLKQHRLVEHERPIMELEKRPMDQFTAAHEEVSECHQSKQDNVTCDIKKKEWDRCDFKTVETDQTSSKSLKRKAGTKLNNKKMGKVTCEKCGIKVSSHYSLRRHQAEVHEGVKYSARENDLSRIHFVSTMESVTVSLDETIIKNCDGSKRVICNKCKANFRDSHGLRRHILEVHDGIKLISRKTFRYLKKQLGDTSKGNIVIIESGKAVGSVTRETNATFSCSECNTIAGSFVEMIQHYIEVHSKVGNASCELEDGYMCQSSCEKFSDLASPLKMHIVKTEDQSDNHDTIVSQKIEPTARKKKRAKEKYSCRKCSVVFKDHYYLKHHRLEQHKRTMLHERKCMKLFKAVSEVKVKFHHAENNKECNKLNNKKMSNFTCEKCGFKLTSHYNLKRHQAEVHEGKQRYFANNSDNFIAKSDNLKQPILEEQEDKSKTFKINSQNNAYAGKKTLSDGDDDGRKLEIHVQFTCNYCGATFPYKHRLHIHLLAVHQGIKYIPIKKHKRRENSGITHISERSLTTLNKDTPSSKLLFCIKCGISFNHKVTFRRHLFKIHKIQQGGLLNENNMQYKTGNRGAKIHQRPQNLSCSKCGIRIETISRIKEHYNEAHLKEPVKHIWYRSRVKSARTHRMLNCLRCFTCKATFNTYAKWKDHAHMDRTTVNNKVSGKECTSVGKNSRYEQNAFHVKQSIKDPKETFNENALISKHESRLYKCRFCQKKLSCQNTLTKHETLHVGKVGIRCFACRKFFLSRKYLICHMKSHIQETKFECNTCLRIFSSLKKYRRHIESNKHVSEGKILCDTCSKTFKTMSALNSHKQLHVEIKPEFVCNVCAMSFFRYHRLLRHQLVHTTSKPHKCNYCSSTFKDKYALKAHMLRRHTDRERRYACDNCPKAFYYAWDLRKHQRWVHKGEKPHCCQICEKCFVLPCELKNHLKIHTDERTEICEICGKAFRNKTHLRAHLRMHRGEKLWGCEKCGVRYTDKRSYNRHIGCCTA